MKIQSRTNSLSINLSPNELRYLAQLFGPGWIFGLEDPSENISDGEVEKMAQEAFTTLSEESLIAQEGHQIRVDEILGGMVYSCIHSQDMLIVKDLLEKKENYFHFLPQWQTELCKIDGNYELTLFQQREDLFKHLVFISNLKLDTGSSKGKFSIPQRELELAAYLFDSGKTEKAAEALSQGFGTLPDADNFLGQYLSPNFHIRFDLLRNRDEKLRMHTTRNELLHTNHSLYWISYDEAGEEAIEMMNFTSVSPKQAERRFNMMLPSD